MLHFYVFFNILQHCEFEVFLLLLHAFQQNLSGTKMKSEIIFFLALHVLSSRVITVLNNILMAVSEPFFFMNSSERDTHVTLQLVLPKEILAECWVITSRQTPEELMKYYTKSVASVWETCMVTFWNASHCWVAVLQYSQNPCQLLCSTECNDNKIY